MSSATPVPARTVPRLLASILVAICLTRLGTSIFLPALPMMQTSLGVSLEALNATLTVFFIAYAAATLVAGPLVDSFGRRPVIRLGLIVFIVGSLLCGFAQAMPQLWSGRILQAVGVAFIPVAGRVMVRDVCDDRQMLSALGWISAISSVGPILAAVLGGVIVKHAGWQATFHVLSLAGVAVTAFIWRSLPETITEPKPFSLGSALRSYVRMLASGSFSIVVLPVSLCFALQGVYFAAAPYIFVHSFKLSPAVFGLSNIVLLAALLCGRPLALFLSKRYSTFTAYVTPAVLTVTAGVLLLYWVRTDTINPVKFLCATGLYCMGFGAMVPVGMQSILTAWKSEGGKASSLFGFSTFGAMALGSFAVGVLSENPDETLEVMAFLTFAFGLLVLLSAALTRGFLQKRKP
ncbi:MAG: multidrug transporter CflA [Rariglobus sp.]|nr:multidrug transporter CflA [Rariglobus sp.]